MDTPTNEGIRMYFTFNQYLQKPPQNQSAFWEFYKLEGTNHMIFSENKIRVDPTKSYKTSIDIQHVEGHK